MAKEAGKGKAKRGKGGLSIEERWQIKEQRVLAFSGNLSQPKRRERQV